jgi:hypothetical protein
MALRTVTIAASVVAAAAGVLLVSGCESNTRALFTKPELFGYERYAVLGLDPEQEQIFMAAYTKTFSERIITFVERKRLNDILSEQDLLKGRLDERTRAKIKRIFGVEALIMCDYSTDERGRGRKFRVRIVDSETGTIAGSVLVEAYGDFDNHALRACEELKDDLLSGGYRGYYGPGSYTVTDRPTGG